jgi:hypothetical protein
MDKTLVKPIRGRARLVVLGAVAWSALVPIAHAQPQARQCAPAGTLVPLAGMKDAGGQIVLQGEFTAPVEEDGGLEHRARLAPTGVDADAAGEAEVEFAKTGATSQEVEFSVRNVQPGGSFTFVIDGLDVASATSDRRGRAEVEVDVRMP